MKHVTSVDVKNGRINQDITFNKMLYHFFVLDSFCAKMLVDNLMLNFQCFIRGESYSNI